MSEQEKIYSNIPEEYDIEPYPERDEDDKNRPYKASYESKSGRRIDITVKPTYLIGKGNFNEAFEAIIDVEPESLRSRSVLFVVKRPVVHIAESEIKSELHDAWNHHYRLEYKDAERIVRSKKQQRTSFTEVENHGVAKEAGLRVFDACRICYSEDFGYEVVMSSGNSAKQICISDKGEAAYARNFEVDITEIEDVDLMIREFLDQARVAAMGEVSIQLNRDAYFFLVNTENSSNVSFIVGDYSFFEKTTDRFRKTQNWTLNLEEAAAALYQFFAKNLPEEVAKQYRDKVKGQLDDIYRSNGLSVRMNLEGKLGTVRNIFLGRHKEPKMHW